MSILVGYRTVNYTNKNTGKPVVGTNLYLVVPPSMEETEGQEVTSEFVRPEVLQGVALRPGMKCEIIYSKGFGGKVVVSRLLPLDKE